MKLKFRLVSVALISLPLLYITLIWDRLPTHIPLHFDQDGKADRFGNRQQWLNALFVTVLVASIFRGLILSLVSKQAALTHHQRVMLYTLTAGFVGGTLWLLLLQGIQEVPVFRDWYPVLFFLLGSSVAYYGVSPNLPTDTKQGPAFNLSLERQLAFRQQMHALSRLVTIRVNVLAVVVMVFSSGQDRWLVGILANMLAITFLAGYSIYLHRNNS